MCCMHAHAMRFSAEGPLASPKKEPAPLCHQSTMRILFFSSSSFTSCSKNGGLQFFALVQFCCYLRLIVPVSPILLQKSNPSFSAFRFWRCRKNVGYFQQNLLLLQKPKPPTRTILRDTLSQEEKIFRDEQWKERAKHWVILVDDEEAIRHAVGDFLFDQGYQVTACSDADAMFQVILNKTGVPNLNSRNTNDDNFNNINGIPAIPDIIISDVRMPGKNGIQLTEIIRGNERLRRVPIVLLTAKSFTQDRVAGYKAGADVYLPKPFSPEELLSIIDGVILRRQQMAGERGKLADLAEELAQVKHLLQRDTGRVNIASRRQIHLTPKEQEVLEMLSRGFTNSEIAAERGVSVVGVNRTIQTLYRKTSTSTRTELVRWGIQSGQLPK